jgi:UDP-hydrolysing UDP-N-acetyl-D-glucosamine 2-epimerase
MTRTIGVVTATRAEYGLLRWLMRDLRSTPNVVLRCIVTGAHLSRHHGHTVDEIEKDGFVVDARVDMLLGSDTPMSLVKGMALCMLGVGEALDRIRPDILVILGDRYELLPIASAATVLRIPIAHISGGDLTLGAIDNDVRHAVTKLAHLHFPGSRESAERLVQIGEDPARVFEVGEPGLDNFVRSTPIGRGELAASLDLPESARWALFSYHPETLGSSIDLDAARCRAALEALAELPELVVLMTAPNADTGGQSLAAVLDEFAQKDPARFKLRKSLGHDRFGSFLRQAWVMVGNSSAGIVEAPAVKLPVVNIGSRQRGRAMASNVLSVDGEPGSIRAALARVEEPAFRLALASCRSPYGDGTASAQIARVLATVPLEDLLRKPFHASHRG